MINQKELDGNPNWQYLAHNFNRVGQIVKKFAPSETRKELFDAIIEQTAIAIDGGSKTKEIVNHVIISNAFGNASKLLASIFITDGDDKNTAINMIKSIGESEILKLCKASSELGEETISDFIKKKGIDI